MNKSMGLGSSSKDINFSMKGINQTTRLTSLVKNRFKFQRSNMHKYFDRFILTIIILSTILLTIDNPTLDQESNFVKVIGYFDTTFTIIFIIEAIIKIIAKGFCKNRLGPILPYISNPWNQLDFFVVSASILDLAFVLSGIDMTAF